MKLTVNKKISLDSIIVDIKGSKNALLHLMFAGLLSKQSTTFTNVPISIHDYQGAKSIITYLGSSVEENSSSEIIISGLPKKQNIVVPIEYTKKTRCSLMLLGALLKQKGNIRIGYPGGCSFSDRRPFDIHLEGLQALGAKIECNEDFIEASHTLDKDAKYRLRYPSVGATINLIMYCSIGRSLVELENIAIEPEVVSLVAYLINCGANIKFTPENRKVSINGVSELIGCNFAIIYDRIQIMTYAALAYLHKINIEVLGIDHLDYIEAPLNILKKANANFVYDNISKKLIFKGHNSSLNGVKITARPYPDFPTDLQPIFAVMLMMADSESLIEDSVYPERIKYIAELQKTNASIDIFNDFIRVKPLKAKLFNAEMQSFDLRAGMACLMAGSLIETPSTITHAQQIFRGYDSLIENMSCFMNLSVIDE